MRFVSTTQVDGRSVSSAAASRRDGLMLIKAVLGRVAIVASIAGLVPTDIALAQAPPPATAVRVIPPGEVPAIAAVTVSPASVSLASGSAQQFAAVVSGTANQRVTWSATGGAITSSGAYTAATAAGTYRVIATITGGTISAAANVTVAASSTATTTYLSDWAWTSAANGYGPAERDQSNGEDLAGDGHPLTANGVTFPKGLGVHAPAVLEYAVNGACSTLTAAVGVDDEVGANGSVTFQVWTDGVQRYASGTMTGAMASQNMSVNIAGATKLALIVTDGGDGSDYDHADWANARITCGSTADITPPTVTAVSPASAATGVVAVANVTATFSEAVNAASVTTLSMILAPQGGASVAATVVYDATSRTATLHPTTSLAQSATYTATVKGGSAGVKDLAGNPLAVDKAWSFTTVASTPPGGTTCPSGAIVVSPGTSIQSVVDANATGASLCLQAGVHRLQSIRPKDGNTFTGEPGTVLSGARLLTSFAKSGNYWVASGQTQQGTVHGQCQPGYARCSYPEQLFIDDQLLLHVASLAEVIPGKWFFDYPADQIYFATDPAGHRVETSVTTTAFDATGNNVTISGLTIEKYANLAQFGAIHPDGKTGWVIAGNQIRWNHGVGLRVSTGARVTGNNVHHNGQMGIGGGGSDALVEGNEIAYNNSAGFDAGWEAGGTKFWATTRLIVRNNFSHHNNGPGLWLDIDNINFTIEGNRTEDNFSTSAAAAPGIFVEISYGGVIRNNTVRRNGAGFNAWLWGAGILIAASGGAGLEVVGNTVEDNEHGIGLIQQSRGSGPYGTYTVQNVYVHDNTIRMPKGMTGAVQDVNDLAIFNSRNNRFEHNTYYLTPDGHFAWMNAERTDTEWKAYGMDTTGTFIR
jgi:hypothetical protein